MNARDFCYWLQGTFEIGKLKQLDEEQTEIVRKHLNMVFVHDLDKQFPADVQKKLDEIHNPPVKDFKVFEAQPVIMDGKGECWQKLPKKSSSWPPNPQHTDMRMRC
ncbi:hypothetical protein D3C87_278950 [compost metagenome]